MEEGRKERKKEKGGGKFEEPQGTGTEPKEETEQREERDRKTSKNPRSSRKRAED